MSSKTKVLGILGVGVLALATSRPAQAAAFVNIHSGASSVSCDNGTAAGVASCLAAGFVTSLDSTGILWSVGGSTMSVGGYTFDGPSGVGSNVPGTATLGRVSELNGTVSKDGSAVGNLFVEFGAYNFTLPLGPDLILSGTQAANYDESSATDVTKFTAWARADNSNSTTPGGTVSATSTDCVPGAGSTTSCAATSPDVGFTRLLTNYSLFGHEEIQLALGSVADISARVVVTPTAVPEPATLLLLGSGLIGGATRMRKRWAKK